MNSNSLTFVQLGAGRSPTRAAIEDLWNGLSNWHLWTALGWLDVKQRYRRAILGPFWITISMGVLVFSLGVIYAGIFRQNVHEFLPYLAAGFIIWYFFSATVSDGAVAFIQAEGLIKHGGIPLSTHVFRAVYRNLIVGAHNLTVMLLLYIWQPSLLNLNILLLIPGLVLIVINLTWIAILVGVLCTRYRDLPPIIANLLQILMFLSPVMFRPITLPPHLAFIVDLNPIYYFIEAVRAPLLGNVPPAHTYVALIMFALFGLSLSFWLFRLTRSRMAYWV